MVGVNKFKETEPSPLSAGEDAILTVPHGVEAEQIARLNAWRASRDQKAVEAALKELRQAARDGRNIMPASIVCAKAGVTTGEWGEVLRDDFGQYRAPTGVGRAARNDSPAPDDLRADIDRVSKKLGRRLKFLVGKPGLDGHSNGAEQIAVRARDAGMDVVYEGIRLTPAEIVESAREQRAHVVGLSILSGSHVPLVKDVVMRMKDAGLDDIPVVVGGIIPPEDARDPAGGRRRRGLHAEGFRAQPHHEGRGRNRRKECRQGGVASPHAHQRRRVAKARNAPCPREPDAYRLSRKTQ